MVMLSNQLMSHSVNISPVAKDNNFGAMRTQLKVNKGG